MLVQPEKTKLIDIPFEINGSFCNVSPLCESMLILPMWISYNCTYQCTSFTDNINWKTSSS